MKRFISIIICFRLNVNTLKQINYNKITYNLWKGKKMYRRIRDLREDAGLNQTKVAQHL